MTEFGVERTVQVNGVRLTYREYGNPAAPPMVFVHGLFDNALHWGAVVPAFADQYHIYALNQRGHATSAYPGVYSFDLMAQDLIGFLNALDLERVTLVGHSLGGIVSFFVAGEYPEQIAALVMEEAPPPRPTGATFDFGGQPEGELPYDWEAAKAIIGQLNAPDPTWWDGAARITAPTLMIGGGPTSHIPQEWITQLAALIPNSQVVTLSGGHLVHHKHPGAFVDAVKVFLKGLNT